MKTLTRKQLEARKAQAVRFVRDVLGDDDKADDIEDESLEDYADHRHIKIANPKGVTQMAAPTRQELLDRIEKLETENEDLQSRLDEIADIIGDNDEEEDTDDDEGDQGGRVARPFCGENWRKTTDAITDRAKRYRANAPECLPAPPAECAICGSRRFLVVDHIDGDESNGSPDNLRWLCKSCNTRLGLAMARRGQGIRTRQFNPGAGTLAEYVQAAVEHRRGTHDEGGRVIHETPPELRSKFAKEIWRRRRAHGN